MIIIGGGVGPIAGVLLHRKIVEATVTDGTDQDHPDILHISQSRLVGDRTEFLQGKEVPDPAVGMFEVFRTATRAVAGDSSIQSVGGVPCNTFHVPAIFRRFLNLVDQAKLPVRILDMLEETVVLASSWVPSGGTIGLLSTTGTRTSGVYREYFGNNGYRLVEIPEAEQALLHEAIYDRTWGLKAIFPPTDKAAKRVNHYIDVLVESGAEAVILGCTELPLVVPEGVLEGGIPVIDPLTALARALIRVDSPEKLHPPVAPTQ